jgi:apolipoprotein N-acyltransferase
MAGHQEDPTEGSRKYRRWQFSLRGLLVLILAISFLLAFAVQFPRLGYFILFLVSFNAFLKLLSRLTELFPWFRIAIIFALGSGLLIFAWVACFELLERASEWVRWGYVIFYSGLGTCCYLYVCRETLRLARNPRTEAE